MRTINVKEIIDMCPDCATNGSKFRAFLLDLYPDTPKAVINTLTTIISAGIAIEILNNKEITEFDKTRWRMKLEDDYGISDKIINECIDIFIVNYSLCPVTQCTLSHSIHENTESTSNTINIVNKSFTIDGTTLLECIEENPTSITIPNGITEIADKAFNNKTKLTSITLPKTIKTISNSAFIGTTRINDIYYEGNIADWCQINNLGDLMSSNGTSFDWHTSNHTLHIKGQKSEDTIVVEEGITRIPKNAFAGCNNIVKVTLPQSLTTIEDRAFANTGLTHIELPNTLLKISAFTFFGCSNLKSISIPKEVKVIENNAFTACRSLQEVHFLGKIKDWCELSGLKNIMTLNKTLYIGGIKIEGELIIPNDVLVIGENAFSNCNDITEVKLGTHVRKVCKHAFFNCKGLTKITATCLNTKFEKWAFESCSNVVNISLQGFLITADDEAFNGEKVEKIIYAGSVEQWHGHFNKPICNKPKERNITIECNDRTIDYESIDSPTPSHTTYRNNENQAKTTYKDKNTYNKNVNSTKESEENDRKVGCLAIVAILFVGAIIAGITESVEVFLISIGIALLAWVVINSL